MLAKASQRPACCLLCLNGLSRIRPSASNSTTIPLGVRAMGGGPRTQPKYRPARLQLSQRVAISEPARPAKRKSVLYPGGLNQWEANLPPPRRPSQAWTQRQAVQAEGEKEFKTPKKQNKRPEFKHLRMARALETVPKGHKQRVRQTLNELGGEFMDYPLLPSIQDALAKDIFADLDHYSPTPVQRLTIPTLLDHEVSSEPPKEPKSFLMAAETGSGKTLAYLLPLIHNLKKEEALEVERKVAEAEAAKNAPGKSQYDVDPSEIDPGIPRPRPRVVILLPTAELVSQVGSIVKKLSHAVKFRSILLSRNFSPTVIKNSLQANPDVVIATPHLLSSIAQSEPDILGGCHYLVADEADTLFDRSFREITQSILVRAENLKQLILCSATIPKSLDTTLRKIYPNLIRLVTPNIHAIPRRVTLGIIDVDDDPYKGNKKLACADVLYNIARDPDETGFVKKVVVFVNSRDTTTPLTEYLQSKDIDVVEFGRDTQSRSESKILEYFTGPKVEAPLIGGSGPRAALKRMKVLVTTDIASRGVDTKQVRNVLLYDVPFSTVDFIHRAGRAGRMGKRGRAFVLVDKQTNKGWVRDIKDCMHMGQGLL
ncbi:P-loop containing nucleoside triphosphate hydrolase protein [Terfezia boudieri ATCC MYA-4762]|uniref:RNA helicase n=1 Tax=Terfezia boudieri ATCC MYA-4762 TaxID=1051890 RepID=A0A3N4LDN3_9PEZI|nr:P-loop containing nucleoside triphosphate hydrolase protein [Terfezia boudieri ATCC MYA-4762]